MIFKLKYISFDCYGILINFEMGLVVCRFFVDCVDEKCMLVFLDSFCFYCFDEVLGVWKLFLEVVDNVICCICYVYGVECWDSDGQVFYVVVLIWQLYLYVVEMLEKIVFYILLVIFLNFMIDLILYSVVYFKVFFYVVYIVEEV